MQIAKVSLQYTYNVNNRVFLDHLSIFFIYIYILRNNSICSIKYYRSTKPVFIQNISFSFLFSNFLSKILNEFPNHFDFELIQIDSDELEASSLGVHRLFSVGFLCFFISVLCWSNEEFARVIWNQWRRKFSSRSGWMEGV